MTNLSSEACEKQLNEVSEELNHLLLDFNTDVMEGRAERRDATCSVSLCPAFRYYTLEFYCLIILLAVT